MGLIPFAQRFIAGTSTRTVSARKLHEFFGVNKVFAAWIRDRIQQYEFTENHDYIEVVSKTGKNPRGGRPSIEYWVTIDMAKELAMVERTEKGREARRYFIDCEKQLQAKRAAPDKPLPVPINIQQRFLAVMDGAQITSMALLPENAMIAAPDNLAEVVRKMMPEKVLVDYSELSRLCLGFYLIEQNHKIGMDIVHGLESTIGRELYDHPNKQAQLE